MILRRLLQEGIVAGFLLITLSGFMRTMTGRGLPLVPGILTSLSYGAMAPYQGHTSINAGLAAEGQTPDGHWTVIDLRSYYPFAKGRQDVRMFEIGFRKRAERVAPAEFEAFLRKKFAVLASRLLLQERERGKPYTAVRIFWETWPLSSMGHDALHDSTALVRTFITQYP